MNRLKLFALAIPWVLSVTHSVKAQECHITPSEDNRFVLATGLLSNFKEENSKFIIRENNQVVATIITAPNSLMFERLTRLNGQAVVFTIKEIPQEPEPTPPPADKPQGITDFSEIRFGRKRNNPPQLGAILNASDALIKGVSEKIFDVGDISFRIKNSCLAGMIRDTMPEHTVLVEIERVRPSS